MFKGKFEKQTLWKLASFDHWAQIYLCGVMTTVSLQAAEIAVGRALD